MRQSYFNVKRQRIFIKLFFKITFIIEFRKCELLEEWYNYIDLFVVKLLLQNIM